jgi:predicted CopG family antitoxin
MPTRNYDPIRGFRLPDDLWEQIQKRAKKERLSASAVVRRLIERGIAQSKARRIRASELAKISQ